MACQSGDSTFDAVVNAVQGTLHIFCEQAAQAVASSNSSTGSNTSTAANTTSKPSAENSTQEVRCGQPESVIEQYFFIAMDSLSVLLIIIFMFLRKRKSLWPKLCGGRPGIAIPYDIFDDVVRRVGPIAAYCVLSFVFIKILEQKLPIEFTVPAWLAVVRYMVNVIVFGLAFFPLFAGITHGGYFGFLVGIFYAIIYCIYLIAFPLRCSNADAGSKNVYDNIPIYIAVIILVIMNAFYLIKYIRSKPEDFIDENSRGFLHRNDFRIAYVRSLLKRKDPEKENKPNFLVRIFRRFYPKHEGFRFSALMLSITVVCMIILYWFILQCLYEIVEVLTVIDFYDKELNRLQKARELGLTIIGYYTIEDLSGFFETLIYISRVLLGILIADVVVSVIITGVNLILTLLSYRRNTIALYKGKCQEIRQKEDFSNPYVLVATVRYGGYQIAYVFWGFFLLSSLLFAVMSVLAVFIILIENSVEFRTWLLDFVRDKWLAVVFTFAIYFIQLIICRFCFLQERGKHLALNNRRIFFCFTYFMIFFNVFVGFFSALLRILKGAFVGTVLLSRLDKSIMPRTGEMLDPGHSSYCGLLYTEVMHSHPVLVVFSNTLLEMIGQNGKMGSKKITYNALETKLTSIEEEKTKPHTKTLVRNRWLLAITLHNNMSLRTLRHHYITRNNMNMNGIENPMYTKYKSDGPDDQADTTVIELTNL